MSYRLACFLVFFNDTATTEIYTLSLHDSLPICHVLDRSAFQTHDRGPGHVLDYGRAELRAADEEMSPDFGDRDDDAGLPEQPLIVEAVAHVPDLPVEYALGPGEGSGGEQSDVAPFRIGTLQIAPLVDAASVLVVPDDVVHGVVSEMERVTLALVVIPADQLLVVRGTRRVRLGRLDRTVDRGARRGHLLLRLGTSNAGQEGQQREDEHRRDCADAREDRFPAPRGAGPDDRAYHLVPVEVALDGLRGLGDR